MVAKKTTKKGNCGAAKDCGKGSKTCSAKTKKGDKKCR